MKNLGETTGLPIQVYGPEINMTAIVGMALGEDTSAPDNDVVLPPRVQQSGDETAQPPEPIFTNKTQAIIFGRQVAAAQVRKLRLISYPLNKGIH
jgi:ATP citrate lyase citrate-binding